MKHPRAELIAIKIENMGIDVWRYRQDIGGVRQFAWFDASFNELCNLAITDRFAVGPKPTEPPQKMCTLAGIRFPAPIPEAAASFFLLGHSVEIRTNSASDNPQLSNRYFFRSLEEADLFATALCAAAEQAIKEAK